MQHQRPVLMVSKPRPLWQAVWKSKLLDTVLVLIVLGLGVNEAYSWISSSAQAAPAFVPQQGAFLGRGFKQRMLEQKRQDILNEISYIRFQIDEETRKQGDMNDMLDSYASEIKGIQERLGVERQERVRTQTSLAALVTEKIACDNKVKQQEAQLSACGAALEKMRSSWDAGDATYGLSEEQLQAARQTPTVAAKEQVKAAASTGNQPSDWLAAYSKTTSHPQPAGARRGRRRQARS